MVLLEGGVGGGREVGLEVLGAVVRFVVGWVGEE